MCAGVDNGGDGGGKVMVVMATSARVNPVSCFLRKLASSASGSRTSSGFKERKNFPGEECGALSVGGEWFGVRLESLLTAGLVGVVGGLVVVELAWKEKIRGERGVAAFAEDWTPCRKADFAGDEPSTGDLSRAAAPVPKTVESVEHIAPRGTEVHKIRGSEVQIFRGLKVAIYIYTPTTQDTLDHTL